MRIAQVVAGRAVALSVTLDADGIAEGFGMTIKRRPLGERLARVEALLSPTFEGRFNVIINTDFQPDDERISWLLAHEIGHSLFWSPGSPPRRTVRTRPEEEDFADAFADDLVRLLDDAQVHRDVA